MREILFRGKRVDNGEWFYGVPTIDSGGETVIVKNVFDCEEYDCRGASCLYVDENTIGQYTGLTDKNGKKVFEGDIVKWDYPCNSEHFYQVKYDGGCACFTTSRIHNSDVIDCIFDNDGNHCEVIGNIHDNPEMMKERDRRSNESN